MRDYWDTHRLLQQYSTFKNRQRVVAVHLKRYRQTYVYLYENVQQVCNIHMLFGLCEPVTCFDEMHLKCIKTCLITYFVKNKIHL